MEGDCFAQYYPALTYISSYCREFITNLLHGKIVMYDSAIGFGDDIIGALSYYGFGDIFLLTSSFFPKEYMSYAYSLIVVLRMYLSGISFLFYGRYKKIYEKGLFIGTFMYVFSFYAIGLGLSAFNFSTPMVYLPIIIWGIDNIVDKGNVRNRKDANDAFRISLLYILALFLISLCGFYFLYMVTLASIAYFIILSVIDINNGKYCIKVSFRNFTGIAMHYVIGIGLAMILLLPVICEYLQCQRTGDSGLSFGKLFELPTVNELKQALRNIITPSLSSGEKGLSIPIIAVFAVLYVFAHVRAKRNIKKLIFCIIAVIGYLFPIIGTISNGFSYSSHRWFFILFFFLSYMVSLMYQDLSSSIYLYKKDLIVFCIAFVLWLISAIMLNEKSIGITIRITVYAILWAVYLVVMFRISSDKISDLNKAKAEQALFFVVIFNIVLNSFLYFAPVKIGGSGIGASFIGLNFVYPKIADSKLAEDSNNKCDSETFVRYDYNDTAFDAPLILGVDSAYSYYSICNGELFNIYEETRISPAIMDTFIIQGLDSRQVLETIMSVKKYALNTDDFKLKDNDYYLPIGFTYDSAVNENDISNLDYLQKTNTMMSDVIIDDDDAAYYQQEQSHNDTVSGSNAIDTFVNEEKLRSEVELNKERNIPITISYGDGVTANGNKLIIENGATISISFEKLISDEPGKEYYLQLNNFTKEFSDDSNYKADVNLAGKYVRLRSIDNEWFYNNNFDYLVQVNDAASTGKIDIVFQDAGEYTLDSISLIENTVDGFEEKYSKLGKDVLQNSSLENNHLSGSTSLESGKWMFVSLPYSKGWSCTIDGEKTHISKANYSFMAVFVPTGEHNIVFSYVTPGIIGGAIVSLLSLIILIVLIIFSKSRIRKDDSV